MVAYEAQRASSGGPTLLNFHTSPFVHRKYMNGRLRPPAAAAAAAVRHAAARHAAVRHAACLRRREESNDRCFVSSLTLLMATASGRVATPISSAPARRTLQTTEVPCVEAQTLGDDVTRGAPACGRLRRRPAVKACGRLRPPAAAFEVRLGHDHLTIVEASKRTFARILPSLVSCEAVSRQRR